MFNDLKVEIVKVGDIAPYAGNAKEHPDEQVEQIARSIASFGFNDPIAVDENSVIIEGHGRLLAAKKMGLDEVPIIRLKHLTEAQKRAYILAHNKTTLNSGFNQDLLVAELDALRKEEFDLSLTAFDEKELSQLLDTLTDTAKDELDDVPDPPPEKPVTAKGDVYRIGDHVLICGDSLDETVVGEIMDGRAADLLFTDPPYGVNLHYDEATAMACKRRTDGKKVANDDLEGPALTQFLTTAIGTASRFMREGAPFYVCSPIDKEVRKFIEAIETVKLHYQSGITWVKNSLCFSRHDYHPQHEIIHYGWKQGEAHTWNADRKQTTVWHFDRPSKSPEHPTMKPVALVAHAITNSSLRDNVVLDLFGGSGTTMVACQEKGRVARLVELDEGYCDVIVKRMHRLFPELAITRNGEPFTPADTTQG